MTSSIRKKISAKIIYPHAPDLLRMWSRHVPDKINFKGKEYGLEFELFDKETIFKITYDKKNRPTDDFEIADFRNNEGQLVQDIFNHIITTLRTFDHADLRLKRITPNDSIVIEIEVFNESGLLESAFEYRPDYEPPIQFKYLYTQLEDHDGLEGFHFAFEDEQLFALGLLIEANHALMENDYNVCILHCCTAIESCIFPILEEYLKGLFFNKGNSHINSMLKELPMNIKYELVFGTVEKDIFIEEGELLEKLKKHNKLRNSIIHSGNSANRDDAFYCLNDASRFIGMIYLQIKDLNN